MAKPLVFAAIALSALSVFAKADTRLTQDEAVKIAEVFLKAIDVRGSHAAIALTPARRTRYWQQCWRVRFEDSEGTFAVVDVSDSSGTVTWFSNDALFRQLGFDKRPAGPAIPEADAIAKATAVLTAGDAAETVFQIAQESVGTDPPRASAHTWQVVWTRCFNDIPYARQQASVILDAETGSVKLLAKTFRSPPPATLIAKISSADASRISSFRSSWKAWRKGRSRASASRERGPTAPS